MEPVAIVGLSFRMPQEAVDEDSFWSVLEARKNLMTEWPKDRVNIDSFYEARNERKQNKVSALLSFACRHRSVNGQNCG